MWGIETSQRFGPNRIGEILAADQLGEFVGMRPRITTELRVTGVTERAFVGWTIVGTTGWADVTEHGTVTGVGVWVPILHP
jgi:hypothetical protein